MRKTVVHIASVIVLSCFLAACGEPISVPSGTVGRQLSTSGLEEKIYSPGALRLESCVTTACPQMVLLHTGLTSEEIHVGTVFLPKSNVDLSDVKLAIQLRVRPTVDAENQIYQDVTSAATNDQRIREITSEMIYKIYLQRIVPNVMIAVLREYTVEEVLANVDQISAATLKAIQKELGAQPIEVTEVGFPNGIGKPPEQVLEAKRNLFVVNENVARQIRELKGQLEVEKQRQVVQQLRVNNDVANSKIAGLPVSTYMTLKVMERFADERVPLGFIPGYSSSLK